jgi:hypothetical protein
MAGCLSLIPDPYFYPSRIPDPTTAVKEEREKCEISQKYVIFLTR